MKREEDYNRHPGKGRRRGRKPGPKSDGSRMFLPARNNFMNPRMAREQRKAVIERAQEEVFTDARSITQAVEPYQRIC